MAAVVNTTCQRRLDVLTALATKTEYKSVQPCLDSSKAWCPSRPQKVEALVNTTCQGRLDVLTALTIKTAYKSAKPCQSP